MLVTRYALRADVKEGFKEQLSVFLGKVADGYIVAFEDVAGENPHIHAIFTSAKTAKAVRSCFVRECPGHHGNADYSLKSCDDDHAAFIRYICKGKSRDHPPVIWTRQGLEFTEEVIRAAHLAYYVNQDAVIENAKKRKTVETGNVVEQVERICKEKSLKSYQRKEIAEVYLDLFRDARKGINLFAAKAVVNTVCLLLEDPGVQREALASKIADL